MPPYKRFFDDNFIWFSKAIALVCFLWCPLLLYRWHSGDHCTTGWKCPSHYCCTQPGGTTHSGLMSSPAHLTETPPPIIPLLPDLPFVGTLSGPVGHLFFESTASPSQKKWEHSPSSSLCDYHGKKTHVGSPEVNVRSEHSSTWGDKTCPNWYQRLDPALTLLAPFQSNQSHHWSWWWDSYRKLMEYWGSSLIGLWFIKRVCGWFWFGHSLWRLHDVLRHRWGVHTNCPQKVAMEGKGIL